MTSRTGLDFRLLALLGEALQESRWQVADHLLAALEALCAETDARATLEEAYLLIERHAGQSVRQLPARPDKEA